MCAVLQWVRLGVMGLLILQLATLSGRVPAVQTPDVAQITWPGPDDPCHDTTCG
jgi:hypothetical protein